MDDPFAPPGAVDALHGQYGSRKQQRWSIAPEELGAPQIGHFGFFRPGITPTLWRDVADWLAAR
jgi:predicted alpha/beta hydrolase